MTQPAPVMIVRPRRTWWDQIDDLLNSAWHTGVIYFCAPVVFGGAWSMWRSFAAATLVLLAREAGSFSRWTTEAVSDRAKARAIRRLADDRTPAAKKWRGGELGNDKP